jgi:hypothetical protein
VLRLGDSRQKLPQNVWRLCALAAPLHFDRSSWDRLLSHLMVQQLLMSVSCDFVAIGGMPDLH